MDINMTAREDLGLVWMGDMFLPNDSTEVMLDPHPLENQYFQDTAPCLDDMRNRGPPLEVEGFMYLDEFEDPYMDEGNASAKYVTTTSTQTAAGVQPPSRKIKPIKHPALKLQTPIAYQRDTDLSVIPIQRDGMAVCEKCGAIGVKHAFYTRERRFCSMKCARGSADTNMLQSSNDVTSQQWAALTQDTNNLADPLNVNTLDKNNLWRNVNQLQQSAVKLELDMERLASLLPTPQSAPLPPEESPFPPDKKSLPDLENTYDWTPQLSEPGFIAAPVSCFKHAPMADCWDNITVGMKVEVENTDCDNFSEDFPDSFWVATVLRIAGYKALLRYEGFGQNDAKDFWVNLCSSQVHPVGWCATRGKPLIPPKTIEEKYKDWKNFLVKRLTGARTLPSNFYNKVHDSMKSRFRCDLNLEVVDKHRISQVKVATIEKIIGKRLHVRYYDADSDDGGFWCHEDSPLIHPVGWAKRVGHPLDAPASYVDHCVKGLRDKDDATEDLFPIPSPIPPSTAFAEGMKLEAVDPLNLSSICVATIMKVLNDGYMMIRIDSYDEDPSCSDWFCYHMTSPFILPAGFCHMNNIPLTPPKGFEPSTFNWGDYLIKSDAVAAPFNLFNREIPAHGFVLGMRLEAADLMVSRLVCVGTVSRVVGRLLKVHFDGWEEEYDQWLDCESPDMYPVGWCQLVSHKLEPPRTPMKNGIQATKHGRPGRPSKRGRRRSMKGRGGAAGRVPSQGKSIAVMNAISSHLDSPLASQLSDSSMIVDDDDRKEWYQPPTDAPLLTGESVSQDVNSIEGVNEPEMAAEPAGPDQSLPVSSSPVLQVQAPFSAPPPPMPATITNFEGSNSSNMSSSNSNDSIGNTSNNSNNSKTSTSSSNNNNNSCNNSSSTKMIPRLIDASGPVDTKDLVPNSWSVNDVAQFLRINDCSAYSDSFVNQKIDGNKLLALTKDDIIDLTGMKVGPSLKIFDLIQQLKIKVNPAQERMKAGLKKITLS